MPKNKKIDDITKIIPIIRKVTGKLIVQIKSIIENNESVLERNRFILEELELILITAQKLIEVGSMVEIERSGQVNSIQVLKNIIERSGIIDKQSQNLIDEEVNEEESDLAVFIIESVLHLDDIGCDVNGKYENPDMCFDVDALVKIIRNGNMVHTAAMPLRLNGLGRQVL